MFPQEGLLTATREEENCSYVVFFSVFVFCSLNALKVEVVYFQPRSGTLAWTKIVI